ncbi:MAG: radical SAM protein [Candidatus Omnitrophota bacterium]
MITMLYRDLLKNCEICPHRCKVNRLEGQTGKCRLDARLKVHTHQLHFGEEPPISGTKGSGAIFFSYCNLRCVYCQNYQFSQMGEGEYVNTEELARMMLDLQTQGAHNINLVTPTPQAVGIVEALALAKKEGLTIPIVYNTSSYEQVEILRELAGIVDIYLADLRYGRDEMGKKYSAAPDYFSIAKEAVKEMYRQVGLLKVDPEGVAQKGLLIRHLVLPGDISGSEEVFRFLASEIDKDVAVGLMSQYFPFYQAAQMEEISRRITKDEYALSQELMERYGLTCGWIQSDHGLLELAGPYLKKKQGIK